MASKGVARLGDVHVCPLHTVNVIVSGCPTVNVNNRSMALVGDKTACGATIITGIPTVYADGALVAHIGSLTTHGGVITTGSTDTFVDVQLSLGSSGWQQIIGAGKELVNQFTKRNAGMMAEWMSEKGIVTFQDRAGNALSSDAVASLYENAGKDGLTIEQGQQQIGADRVKALPQTPLIIGAATALGTGGKSIVKHPEQFADDLKEALKGLSKSGEIDKKISEAMGVAGGRQGMRKEGITDHPDFKDRHHGHDNIGYDKNGNLSETEFKGRNKDSTAVAEDKQGRKQSSKKKNEHLAGKMKKKQNKVDVVSNRKGGAYTQGEIDLANVIFDKVGKKRHLSTHTNTETGRVRVYERDKKGKIVGKPLHDFTMENFKEMKSEITKAVKAGAKK
ncbi:MAG: PAAR domain-containing protein [Methylococcaceae bacterium]